MKDLLGRELDLNPWDEEEIARVKHMPLPEAVRYLRRRGLSILCLQVSVDPDSTAVGKHGIRKDDEECTGKG